MNVFERQPAKPPRVIVPDFWVSMPDAVETKLASVDSTFGPIGTSAGGFSILGGIVGPKDARLTVGVIGGTHGHESGGTAAAMNLIAAAVTGRDLIGNRILAESSRTRWAAIPLLNPDARRRCPNSFVGLHAQAVQAYAAGWDEHRAPLARKPRVTAPHPLAHLGGLYNDDGVDILNATDGTLEGTDSVEVAAAARFFTEAGCDVVVDLHAHAFSFNFYTPLDGLPEDVSMRGFEVAERVRKEATDAGIAFAAPECVVLKNLDKVNLPSCALYHRVSGAMPLLIEGPQGCVGTYRGYYGGGERDLWDPGYTHRQIIEGYLFSLNAIAAQSGG